MNVKRSVALAIRDAGRPGMLLLVQRPHDDEDLPDVWGLPAASLTGDETPVDAARRAGRDKLGVELEIGAVVNEGTKTRDAYRLEMQLLDSRISRGSPDIEGAASDGTTRYQAWRWGPVSDLAAAAALGSLCSRLALEAAERD